MRPIVPIEERLFAAFRRTQEYAKRHTLTASERTCAKAGILTMSMIRKTLPDKKAAVLERELTRLINEGAIACGEWNKVEIFWLTELGHTPRMWTKAEYWNEVQQRAFSKTPEYTVPPPPGSIRIDFTGIASHPPELGDAMADGYEPNKFPPNL